MPLECVFIAPLV